MANPEGIKKDDSHEANIGIHGEALSRMVEFSIRQDDARDPNRQVVETPKRVKNPLDVVPFGGKGTS